MLDDEFLTGNDLSFLQHRQQIHAWRHLFHIKRLPAGCWQSENAFQTPCGQVIKRHCKILWDGSRDRDLQHIVGRVGRYTPLDNIRFRCGSPDGITTIRHGLAGADAIAVAAERREQCLLYWAFEWHKRFGIAHPFYDAFSPSETRAVKRNVPNF